MDNPFDYGSYGYIAVKNFNSAQQLVDINTDAAMYYMQQATEKIAKQYLQLTYFNKDAASLLHSHKLYPLFAKTKIPELFQYSDIADRLTRYYFDERYPGSEYIETSKEEANLLLTSVENIVAIIVKKTLAIMNSGKDNNIDDSLNRLSFD